MTGVQTCALPIWTYTVDLDDTIDGATSTGGVVIQNWRKAGIITDDNVKYEEITIADDYTRAMSNKDVTIQFKIVLRGILQSPVIEELRISSELE